MRCQLLTGAAIALILTGCNAPSHEQTFVDAMATALGGSARVAAVTMLVIEGEGSVNNLGQDMTWDANGQAFAVTELRRVLDLSGPRARTRQTRTPNFLYFQGPQPQTQVVGFDGGVAYAVAPSGNVSRQSAAVARDRLIDFYHHPLTMLRGMLEASSTVTNVRSDGDLRTADVRIGDMDFVVSLDGPGRALSVSSPGYHPNMGDVTIKSSFADYQLVDGVALPMRITTQIDGRESMQVQVARYALDAPPSEAAAPPALAALSQPTAPVPIVTPTVVADGVWLLAGQSHHSALIEFADHLLLFEAPQSEARTLAVIAKARELVPGKPLTELVMSHHHFDHSGGLRAAVAEGLAVITHRGNAAFVSEMVKRPHTRQPDALQRNAKPLALRVVDDTLTLQDAKTTVVLYSLTGNPHADTMLMAYLPNRRVLIEVDAYSPGGTYHPYAANLLDTIRARKLQVERIVPLHGAIIPLSDLVKAVEAASPRPTSLGR